MGLREIEVRLDGGASLSALLHLPPGHARSTRARWPFVLALHGGLERGRDLSRVASHGLPRYLAKHPAFPFVVVAPQCPARTTWIDLRPLVLATLDELVDALRIDPRRVHVTGASMGGAGSWALAASAPRTFASVVPICGAVPDAPGWPARVRALVDVPVWAFHGALDRAVPLSETLTLVDRLKRAGGDVRLTVLSDAAHDAWTPAYASSALHRWWATRVQPS